MRLWIAAVCVTLTLFCAGPLASQDAYFPSDRVSAPKLLKTAKPVYTSEAQSLRIRGVVKLQIDVLPDGKVGTVALVQSLDPGLDEEAVKAAKKFEFTPGQKDGKPVTVRIELEIMFNMR